MEELNSIWTRSADLFPQREKCLKQIAHSILHTIQPLCQPGWTPDVIVTEPVSYLTRLQIQDGERGEPGRTYSFHADFNFPARTVHMGNLNLVKDKRMGGIGRQTMATFLENSYKAGFDEFTSDTIELGGWWDARQGFQPAYPSYFTSLGRIASMRLDELEKWLTPEAVKDAKTIIDGLSDDPDNLVRLAALDYRATLGDAIGSAQYQAEVARRAEAWSEPNDELAEALHLITLSLPAGRPPMLGQMLLYGTGWKTKTNFADKDQRERVERAMAIKLTRDARPANINAPGCEP